MNNQVIPTDPYLDRDYHVLHTIRAINHSFDAADWRRVTSKFHDVFYFGRYEDFLETRTDQFCRVLSSTRFGAESTKLTHCPSGGIHWSSLTVFEMPSGQIGSIETIAFSGDLDDAINVMEQAYYATLEIEGRSASELIKERLGGRRNQVPSEPTFSRFYHQVFIASKALRREHEKDELVQQLVRRHRHQIRGGSSEHFPKELNLRADSFCAVSRFVTVISRHQSYIESTILWSCIVQTMARQKLSQLGLEGFNLLKALKADTDKIRKRSYYQELLAYSRRVEQLNLDVSLSIEQPLHLGSVIPSLRAEEFHAVVLKASDIPDRIANVDQMLARIEKVLSASKTMSEALSEERAGVRRTTWALILGAASFIAVPTSLIFGFLGSNIREVRDFPSILDTERFLGFYVGTSVLFVGAIVLGIGLWVTLSRRAAKRHREFARQGGGARQMGAHREQSPKNGRF